jgi:TolB protein
MKLSLKIHKFLILTASLLLAFDAFAEINLGGIGRVNDKRLIIEIDNPNFRKLTIAIPKFLIKPGVKSKEAEKLATEGPEELGRLLIFSGMFNIMSESGYKEAYGSLASGYSKSSGTLAVNGTADVGSINMQQWKGFGVEALVIGEIFQEGDSIGLNIRTYDINMGKELKGVQFSIMGTNFQPVLRRAGDIILDLYTGKGGIFNSKIVFIGRRSKGSPKQLFVCDFDGSNLVQISNTKSIHLSPHFSPDGKYVTVTSFESGNPDLYMYELVKSKSGTVRPGMKRRLSGYKGLNSGGQWSPNGKLVAYTGSAGEGDADIFTIMPDSKDRVKLMAGAGLDVDPSFSPDGKYLAFVSGRFGNPHIFTANLKWVGDTKVVVEGDKRLTYAGWYNATPAWSPDSQKIAFGGYDKDIDRWDLFVMNYDGTNMERLTLKIGDNEAPSWSPNGQMLVFHSNRIGSSNGKDRPALYIMNRDGSAQRKLPIDLYELQTPSWSANVFGESN